MKPLWFFVLLAGLALAAPAGAADVYRYTDSRGVVHFVQNPEQIPPQYRPRQKKVTGTVNVAGGAAETELPGVSTLIADHAYEWAKTPLTIAALELVRSKLIVGLLILAVLAAGLVIGALFTRDAPRSERLPLRAKLAGSWVVMMAFFWIALLGPELQAMLRSCEARAEASVSASADEGGRGRLMKFRDYSGRAAGLVEKALLPPQS